MADHKEEFKGQADRLSGKPDSDHKEKTVGSETQDLDMKISAPASDTYLNKAVKHLERETQRGEFAPTVGGYKHDHTMR